MLRAAALTLLLLAGCAGRPASLPPPVEASQVVPAPPPEPTPAPEVPRTPRLPPTPELVALPGGRPVPAAPPGATQPSGPSSGGPSSGGPRADAIAPARGQIARPPSIIPPPAEVEGCFIPANAVTTQLNMTAPGIELDRGRATLAAMTGRPPEGGMHVSGVYRANMRLRVGVRVSTAANGCLVPGVQVSADVQRAIFVASELAPGSCRYNVVLGHEREHARIDDVVLADLDAWIAAPLRQVLAEPGVLRGTGQQLAARINARFEQARAAFQSARNAAQLSIDTPQEYARASRACAG